MPVFKACDTKWQGFATTVTGHKISPKNKLRRILALYDVPALGVKPIYALAPKVARASTGMVFYWLWRTLV